MSEITLPDTTEIEKESFNLLGRAQILDVSTPPAAQAAADLRETAKAHIKKAKELFKPSKSAAHAAHAEICALENTVCEVPQQAVAVLDPKLTRYAQQQRAKQLEAERIAREAARKVAEEEQLARAVELEDAGETAAMEQVISQPVIAQPTVAPAEPTTSGITVMDNWQAEVLIEDDVPRAYCIPDKSKLLSYAKRMGSKAVGSVPGVRFYNKGTVRSTGKA